ncbi:hypothetical protein DNTS_034495, partial [Danionella cerebrum]
TLYVFNTPSLSFSVFKNAVCKVYRFQTVDSKWMLVREQMAECTLSFSVPKQLIGLYIQEDTNRIHELKDLGELSPHWDNLRKDVISRYDQIIKEYQDTLTELEKITGPSFKPSTSKGQRFLEFIPINLHTQRMRVTYSCYDVVTVGAPAAHSQGFKNGGLQKLLSKHESEKKSYSTAYQCIYYPPEQTAKAREILSVVCELQPEISALADELLQSSKVNFRNTLQNLEEKTEQFVHALKDELVKSALLALHAARPGYVCRSQTSAPPSPAKPDSMPSTTEEPPTICNNVNGAQTPLRESKTSPLRSDSIPHHKEYDEEEWASVSLFCMFDRVWASVAKNLNSVIALLEKLHEQENNNNQEPTTTPQHILADVITSHSPDGPVAPVDWRGQLSVLLESLKGCVLEVAQRARRSLLFVLLQEAAGNTAQGLQLQQRRDAVFSQALAALACGFIMRLYAGLEDKVFLKQLHEVGLLVQFESLLSTYSEEIGMLEDMEVGVSDLSTVRFRITEAQSEDGDALMPLITGRRERFTVEVPLPPQTFQALPEELRHGKPLRIIPVLFNVGINEQQTIAERFGDISLQERINHKNFESLEAYYKSLTNTLPSEALPSFQTQTDIKDLLETLGHNVGTKKRKNVEILWLAGMICRRMNGVRFTSCKSAKDRTSMSVTLEQCCLLRDEHQLNKDHFIRALDCMRSGRLSQGELVQWDDPESGSVALNKPASRHFYPIALLLVSSHLLVVWLILSLVFLLAKYQ